MSLPNHLLNQWYNLCAQNNGDASRIRFNINNKQLIQVDNVSFYPMCFNRFILSLYLIMYPSARRCAWKGEMKIEQRISERHGLSQGEGHLDHDWYHRANRPYFDVGRNHEWDAHSSAAVS